MSLASSLGACGASETGEGGGGSGTGSGTGAGNTCYSVAINNSGDGTEACGSQVCQAGQYCFSSVGICDPGCVTERDCAPGNYCNLSNAQPNLDGVPIGICAKPGSDLEITCPTTSSGSGSCADRCQAKGKSCQAPQSIIDDSCPQICQVADESQVQCLEETSCKDLEAAFEGSKTVCGLGG